MCNKNNRSLGNFHDEEPFKNLLNTKRRITTNLSEISAISRTRCRRFFFSRNKIRFSVNLYYNMRIIIIIWSANVFMYFRLPKNYGNILLNKKKTCIFCEITVWLIWRTLRNYILPRIVMKKKIIALVQKLSKTWHFEIKKKKTIWRKKKSFLWALTE